MSKQPCGDITCYCCYPDFRHDCDRPTDASHDDIHPCPDCGAIWAATGFDHLPASVQARITTTLAKLAVTHPDTAPTPEATISWRRLAPATRIPGSMP